MKKKWEAEKERRLSTDILLYQHFTKAENYHQKYYLRRFPRAAGPLIDYYGSEEKFAESWLAARLNAVAAGYLSLSKVKEEVELRGDAREKSGLTSLISQVRW